VRGAISDGRPYRDRNFETAPPLNLNAAVAEVRTLPPSAAS
jgi:hypothetical protein